MCWPGSSRYQAECDVSVSKLLGFETFPLFWWYRIRFRKFLVSKKVSDSVSKFFGIEKSIGFGFDFFWFRKSIGFGFEIFWYRKKDQIKSLRNLPELRRFCELIELCELTWVTLSCPSRKKYWQATREIWITNFEKSFRTNPAKSFKSSEDDLRWVFNWTPKELSGRQHQ